MVRSLLVAAFWVGLLFAAHAQPCLPDRYLNAGFSVDTLKDVVYGNAPQLTTVYVAENVTLPYDLKMDIYLPQGDTLSQRPCVLFAFGGGFLIGAKEDEDTRSVCDSLARKGYVAASINYRLGMNTASNGSAERAVWRGVQDWSAAIRFLKENHLTYRLDTNAFFAGGISAGSFAAIHCQYASDAQRPASTLSASFPPQPDLGCKDCSGNSFSHLSSVKALINCWGAIGDTSWIDAQDSVPMVSFHGDLDPIVPYGYGFPFTALFTIPQVYGSSLMTQRMNHVGVPNYLNTFWGEGHNIWGTVVANEFTPGPTVYWEPILDSIRLFLWRQIKPGTPIITGPASVSENDISVYSVPSVPGYKYCWSVNGGIITNQTGSSITVLWQSAGVRDVRVRNVSHLDAVGDEAMMPIQVLPVSSPDPHPQTDFSWRQMNGELWVKLHTAKNGPATALLTDVAGRTIWEGSINIQAGEWNPLALPSLPGGVYLLQITQGQARLAEKILLD